MTRKEIIDGLKFTVDMFLFDVSTGETFTEPRNDMDKTTIDACKGAIELLEQTDGDLISRTDLLKDIADLKKSPWFNDGKNIEDLFRHNSYVARKEAIQIVEDLCIKKLPTIPQTDYSEVLEITVNALKSVVDRLKEMPPEDLMKMYMNVKQTDSVLEDIKAEINGLDYLSIEDGSSGYDKYLDKYKVLQIIDKHISRKE